MPQLNWPLAFNENPLLFPRALPWAGMTEAFGLARPEPGQTSDLQHPVNTPGRHRNDNGHGSLPKSLAILFWSCSTLLNPGCIVPCPCRYGFQGCQTALASSCWHMLFAAQRRLLARVFHALRPANNSWPVTHLNHCVRRNQVQIEHLVAL